MSIKLEVWGDFACFTRPEMKVERVSYDVMTPSAARGILDAIYWHPGLKWRIDKIRVCSPIRFTSVRKNEVSSVANARAAKKVMETGKGNLYISANYKRPQRASLFLKDVHYVIEAHFEMTDQAAPSDNPGKFSDIINRRIARGQCYNQPCFGIREFAANFQHCEDVPECPSELKGERDLGWMLLDMDYSEPEDIKPMFFRATMKDGVIEIPSILKKGDTIVV